MVKKKKKKLVKTMRTSILNSQMKTIMVRPISVPSHAIGAVCESEFYGVFEHFGLKSHFSSEPDSILNVINLAVKCETMSQPSNRFR